jgi:hypothetical protein
MASESGSMTKNNTEPSIQVEFLKNQVLKNEFASNEKRVEVLLTKTVTKENEINRLQHVNEEVK